MATEVNIAGESGVGDQSIESQVGDALTVVGYTSCIPRQGLGLGSPEVTYMIYPDIVLNVYDATVTALPGRPVFKGVLADEYVGKPWPGYGTSSIPGAHDQVGIERNYTFNNIDLTNTLPFLVSVPHHWADPITQAPAYDLSGVVPTDGVWYYGPPIPIVVPNRLFRTPRFTELDDDPIGAHTNMLTYDAPFDVYAYQQAYLNIKMWLSFPAGTNFIRLTHRTHMVILFGDMASYNWMPPISICPGVGPCMSCFDTLVYSGSGNCKRTTPTGDIASLGCHCVCQGSDMEATCYKLRGGINTYKQGTLYGQCNSSHDDYMTEWALHGSREDFTQVDWAYARTSEEVNEGRLRDAFDVPDGVSFSQWITQWLRDRLTTNRITLSNSHDTGPTESTITALVNPVGSVIGSHIEPDSLRGTQGLPVDDTTICFPGDPITLPGFQITSIDGWLAQVEKECFYATTSKDIDALWLNPTIDSDLNSYFGTMVAASHAPGGWFMCAMYLHWLNLLGAKNSITGHVYENLPLITDANCAQGIPGFDSDAEEWLFGWTNPGPLFDSSANHAACFYTGLWSDPLVYLTDLYPPPSTATPQAVKDEWINVHNGGFTKSILQTYTYPEGWCDANPNEPPCQDPPPADQGCSYLTWLNTMGPNTGHAWYHIYTQWPKFYILAHPTLVVGIKRTTCSFRVRVYMLNWVLQCVTTYQHSPPFSTAGFAAELGGFPASIVYPFLEIGMGAQCELPIGWTDQIGGMFPSGILNRELWTHMISNHRSLGGCMATSPDGLTIANQGNTCKIFF